jgi:Protein of unknown function (DUF1559)
MRQTTMIGLLAAAGMIGGTSARADDTPSGPTRAQLRSSESNLKQIALAMINSADTNRGALPNNITSKDGKTLLSWLVAILPYIDEGDLYKEFKLDEPWDSDANKKLIEKMPKTYAPIRGKAKAGETFYQVFTGEKSLFVPNKVSLYPASIPDGTSNTGLIFEAGEPVIWTKPADLTFNEKKALPKLGGLFDGEFHVAMCDGSVMRCRKDADEKELRKLIMPADGEPIDIELIRGK